MRPDSRIYHIAYAEDWARAQERGEYRTSTRDTSLEQQGYIHASTAPQVTATANRVYGPGADLVVLHVDTDRLASEVRHEAAPGSGELFPHIYGPINTDAVVHVEPLRPDPDGRFSFPETR